MTLRDSAGLDYREQHCYDPLESSGFCAFYIAPCAMAYMLFNECSTVAVNPDVFSEFDQPVVPLPGPTTRLVVKTSIIDEARKFYSGVLGYDEVFRHKRAITVAAAATLRQAQHAD